MHCGYLIGNLPKISQCQLTVPSRVVWEQDYDVEEVFPNTFLCVCVGMHTCTSKYCGPLCSAIEVLSQRKLQQTRVENMGTPWSSNRSKGNIHVQFLNIHVTRLLMSICSVFIPFHSGPVPVLVMSLLFIACVFLLHIWGKYSRS